MHSPIMHTPTGKWLYRILLFLPFLLLTIPLYLHKTRVHGDASIYFTFIRDFFPLPFTYGYEVKHGATSPLWVIFNAIPYKLLGFEKWLIFATCFNKMLIILGVLFNVLICIDTPNSSSKQRENILIVSFLVFLYVSVYSLFISATQLYETALSIFMPALALFLLKRNCIKAGVFIAGCSVLARPEYFLFFLMVILIISGNKTHLWKNSLLGASSPSIVYGYLYLMTGQLIPTSVSGRFIRSLENETLSYINKLSISIADLWQMAPSLLFAFIVFLFLFIPAGVFKWHSYDRIKMILFVSSAIFILIYLLFPPMGYTNRYLLIMVPLLFPWITLEITNLLSKYSTLFIVIVLLAFTIPLYRHFQLNRSENYRFSFEYILGEDFDHVLQERGINEKDTVLIYEIQFQFRTKARLISADGIVGGEILPCLLKKQSVEEFIKQYRINYIVVSNSYKYRNIYKDTFFSQLFEFDLNNPIGSHYHFSGIDLTKIAINPVLLTPDRYRIENGILVYGPKEVLWRHHSLLWNSIYRVENNPPS